MRETEGKLEGQEGGGFGKFEVDREGKRGSQYASEMEGAGLGKMR